jgi:mRNA-degrading endonuclease toxin of MazEF toxin-antitoxin module
MLRTIFASKSISSKCSTAVAPITSNTATVGESGVLFQIDGRDSVVLLDRVITIEKGRLGKFLGELGDEKALAIATPSMSTGLHARWLPHGLVGALCYVPLLAKPFRFEQLLRLLREPMLPIWMLPI